MWIWTELLGLNFVEQVVVDQRDLMDLTRFDGELVPEEQIFGVKTTVIDQMAVYFRL